MGYGSVENCYCAFCKHERKINTKKHISLTNVLGATLFSLIGNGLLGSFLDPRGFVLFILTLILFEVGIQIRWRLSLPCPYCSFDPVLYLKDPKKMAQKVKWTLEQKKMDPLSVFSQKNPIKNLKPLPPSKRPHLSKRV